MERAKFQESISRRDANRGVDGTLNFAEIRRNVLKNLEAQREIFSYYLLAEVRRKFDQFRRIRRDLLRLVGGKIGVMKCFIKAASRFQ